MKDIWPAKDLVRRIVCPLCEAPVNGTVLIRRWDTLPLCKCPNCESLFVNPVPSESALMRCYEPEYFSRGHVMPRIGPGVDYQTSSANIKTGKVKGYSEITTNFALKGKAILEVGCATGALLQSLKKHAPSVLIGIDIAEQQVVYGKQHFGLDLRCTKLEDAGFAAAQFDLVIMLDVVEHVWDTRAFFAAAIHYLKEGGALFIKTPNADSYWMAGQRWNYLQCGLEHVVYLSKTSLAILARDYNMVIERSKTEGCPSYSPYEHHLKLAKLMFEPLKIASNQFHRWRWLLAAESKRTNGLDMQVTLRKLRSVPPEESKQNCTARA